MLVENLNTKILNKIGLQHNIFAGFILQENQSKCLGKVHFLK
jgi:hypothetical protein